jgi:hypothetical protein
MKDPVLLMPRKLGMSLGTGPNADVFGDTLVRVPAVCHCAIPER